MKEILSHQYDLVSGGWADKDGSGHYSADNGGSRSAGKGNNSGKSSSPSLLDRTVSAYHNNPYGSGSGASGFWGGANNQSSGNGGRKNSARMGLRGKITNFSKEKHRSFICAFRKMK